MDTAKKQYERVIMKKAFTRSLPIMMSYLFIGLAYGMTMAESGFGWLWSAAVSATVYTGAYQFVLISFLSSGASLVTVALTALLMNSRQSFYALSFLTDFKSMGRHKLYMISTLTDETYAVNCALDDEPEEERHALMLRVAVLSRIYWIGASALGGLLGQLIPFDLEGIDFCMTALFIIIFIDRWEKDASHRPAVTGAAVGVICLIIFDAGSFMLPALLISSGLLILMSGKEARA